MENKIKKELENYGLTINNLTPQEIQELKEEIKKKDEGKLILDGVLSRISPYTCQNIQK